MRIWMSILCVMLVFGSPGAVAAQEKDPETVFLEYHAALKSGYSFDSVLPYFTLERRTRVNDRFPAGMRDTAFSLQKSSAPREIEVVNARLDGEQAYLTLSGRTGQDVFSGEAVLRREGGAWLINDVAWRDR